MPKRSLRSIALASAVALAPALLLAFAATTHAARAADGQAGDAALASRPTAHAFSFDAIDGGRIDLAAFAGRPILVVNTASRCGFVNQLAGLQTLHERYGPRGLVVIGVPSNDFRQELADDAAIAAFCQGTWGVAFPLAARTHVVGAAAHPFYAWAARERPGEAPRWNYHKYLVAPDGTLAAAFFTPTAPTDPRILAAIERALRSGA
ncbi:glutathione peroxidase [Salinarimonas chemoclinalis]|uniref:glutathione peroxidase n=1 Tax=Salinarimonas chemoclinalis TaxID=3241599 RepID=UPI0035570A12